jgi:Dolichyl-phosphate-mannose-protein mannosyltransferase/PA14 domain
MAFIAQDTPAGTPHAFSPGSLNKPLVFSLLSAFTAQGFMAQPEKPWTLFPAVFLYLGAMWLFGRGLGRGEATVERGALPGEGWWLACILALAAFLRLYRIGRMPEGIFIDTGALGYDALRLLHGGWKPPFMLPAYAANPSAILYLLAGWFKMVGSSATTLMFFFALFSLASFPLVYWTCRQLSGPRTALTALFLLAVMRWDLIFSRDGFRGICVLFFMFGTLAFLLRGLKTGKPLLFGVAAVFFAGGMYGYQSYRAFPLAVLACLGYEAVCHGKNIRRNIRNILWFGTAFLLLSWPLIHYWIQQGTLGARESQIFIGREIAREGSLRPLVASLGRTAQMFIRKAEIFPKHNYRDHRMLDDGTAVFLVLGLFLALGRLRERCFFYPIAGFGVMCLPSFLSWETAQCHRTLGVLPFVALLAAQALEEVRRRVYRGGGVCRWFFFLFPAILGAAVAWQNLDVYWAQLNDCACWRSDSTGATEVGKDIERHENTFYLITPDFYNHYTVRFLAYSNWDRVGPLDWGRMMGSETPRSCSFLCLVLGAGKSPTLQFLESLAPGGRVREARDPCNGPMAYFYTVPSRGVRFVLKRGLRGSYFHSVGFRGKPERIRLDPLINFTNLGDFDGIQSPISVRWKGKLVVSVPGDYEFALVTRDKGGLWLDGRKVVDTSSSTRGKVRLDKGAHSLDLWVERGENPDFEMDFHLVWKKPGDRAFELVPNRAFGVLETGKTAP